MFMFGADSYVDMLGERPLVPRKNKIKQNNNSTKYYGFHQSNWNYAGVNATKQIKEMLQAKGPTLQEKWPLQWC